MSLSVEKNSFRDDFTKAVYKIGARGKEAGTVQVVNNSGYTFTLPFQSINRLHLTSAPLEKWLYDLLQAQTDNVIGVTLFKTSLESNKILYDAMVDIETIKRMSYLPNSINKVYKNKIEKVLTKAGFPAPICQMTIAYLSEIVN